jgi:hypothetical protein
VAGACRVGAADRIDPQLLAKFASKIRVSTHGSHATEGGRWPCGKTEKPVCDPLGVDPDLYRRRQRRRAVIGWTVGLVVVAFAVLAVVLGNTDDGSDGHEGPTIGIFTAEMTSDQYTALREGEEEAVVDRLLGSVGMNEEEVQEGLLALFPHRPPESNCSYWYLSDAPGHLARLCFSSSRGVLLQKTVAAQGEDAVPKQLV